MKAVLLGLKIAWPVIAENKSKSIIPGIKYLALTGTGKKINISLLSGKNIPKATRTPIIAPDAPTIVDKNEVLKFMQTYQRVTQNMFKFAPKYSSIVLNLNRNHQIKSIKYNKWKNYL